MIDNIVWNPEDQEPLVPEDFEYVPKHRWDYVYFGDDDLGIPADICEACSTPKDGVWVPVSFCPEAKADMERRYRIQYDKIEKWFCDGEHAGQVGSVALVVLRTGGVEGATDRP